MLKAAFVCGALAALVVWFIWPLGVALAVIGSVLFVCGLVALIFRIAATAHRTGRGRTKGAD